MRRNLVIALACMVAVPLAFAQAPAPAPSSVAKTQLALKMYDINKVGSVFEGIEYNIISGTMGEIGQQIGPNVQQCPALQQSAIKPQVQAFKTKLDAMFDGMNNAQFRQEAAKVYADAFTEAEMKQIIAFLQSPAGQKMTSLNDDISKRIGGLAMAHVKAHENDIRAAQTNFADIIQKVAATCPANPPAKQAPAK